MTASLHLARFTPGRAARTLGRMWRGRSALATIPGLATAHVFVLADLEPRTGSLVRPARLGLFCGWDSAETRDGFVAAGAHRFTHDASEVWGVALDTVRVRKGGLGDWVPSCVGRVGKDEPLLVMTYGRLRPRYLWRFTVDNARIVREMIGGPGLEMMVGAADHPLTRATFSVWRTQGDAVRFAYDPAGRHGPVQRASLAAPWMNALFFARFRPVASTGSWLGRDPLAVA